MMITERQEQILGEVVKAYINSAKPISSQLLEKKHNFGVSPATIRNEMQKLTELGYIRQPHTSAGRVPTDRGYRFFVDKLFESDMATRSVLPTRGPGSPHPNASVRSRIALSRWIEEITNFLAEESSDLALGYLAEEKIIWKEGWREIFDEPEFSEPGFAASFARMIDDFEENIEEVFLPETCLPAGMVKIYIGKENPVSKAKDFSIITSGFNGGLFAIVGPKRMSYHKNVELLQKIWEKI